MVTIINYVVAIETVGLPFLKVMPYTKAMCFL